MMSKDEALHKAERHFSQLKKLVEQAIDEGWRIDQVERATFAELLDMGFSLLWAIKGVRTHCLQESKGSGGIKTVRTH